MLKKIFVEKPIAFVVSKTDLLSISFEEIKELLSDYNMILKESYYDERYDFNPRTELVYRVNKHFIYEEDESRRDEYNRVFCSQENFYKLLNRSFEIILKNNKYNF